MLVFDTGRRTKLFPFRPSSTFPLFNGSKINFKVYQETAFIVVTISWRKAITCLDYYAKKPTPVTKYNTLATMEKRHLFNGKGVLEDLLLPPPTPDL